MSEASQSQSKGRGRGRWKDSTPNERVAQWVNQREARRLNKLRWASREQEAQAENEKDGAFAEDPRTEEINEKGSSKKSPQVQLYVPPSLRGEQRTPCSTRSQHVEESGECKSDVVAPRSKGRGRGRRKPEQAVYVPRALREKNKNRATAESETGSGDGQSQCKELELEMPHDTKQGTDLNTDLNSSLGRKQKEEGISAHSDSLQHNTTTEQSPDNDTHMSSPEPDFNHSAVAHKNTDIEENHSCVTSSSACSPPSSALNSCTPISENISSDSCGKEASPLDTATQNAVQDTNNLSCENYMETSLHSQIPVSPEDSQSSHTNVPLENPYTFEFYDPAVLAFMPSSPNTEAPNKNSNNPLLEADIMRATSEGQSVDNQCHEGKNSCSIIQSETRLNSPSLSTDHDTTAKSDQLQGDRGINLSNSLTSKDSDPLLNVEPIQEPKPALQSTAALNAAPVEEEDAGDSWDTMFDDNGDCIDEALMEELVQNVGKVGIDHPKINYLKFEPKQTDLDLEAFSHIVEIYDFSPDLATCDLVSAFRDFVSRGFDVKWVDDTHALGVFSSAVAASEALRMIHPMLKVRPMSQASKQGLNKAKHCQEFLQPYKARPETTSLAARRLVAGALGMAPKVSREVRDKERQKLKEAKEKRRQERQQKVDVWDGSFGKCAMDEV